MGSRRGPETQKELRAKELRARARKFAERRHRCGNFAQGENRSNQGGPRGQPSLPKGGYSAICLGKSKKKITRRTYGCAMRNGCASECEMGVPECGGLCLKKIAETPKIARIRRGRGGNPEVPE